LEGLERPCQL